MSYESLTCPFCKESSNHPTRRRDRRRSVRRDTISEWRRMFRKYRAQGFPLLWCVTMSWTLERLGRKQRAAAQSEEARQ